LSRKKQLQKTVEKCVHLLEKKYKVKKIFLIGSLASGFMHEKSDIDLVVEGLPSDLYIRSLTDLWDLLPPGVELNLIPYEDAFKSLKEKTIKEGIILHG